MNMHTNYNVIKYIDSILGVTASTFVLAVLFWVICKLYDLRLSASEAIIYRHYSINIVSTFPVSMISVW